MSTEAQVNLGEERSVGAETVLSPRRPADLAEDRVLAAQALLCGLLDAISANMFSPRVKLLSQKQVILATGLSKSTITKMVEEGKFPKPQKELGKNMWRESALIHWMDANDPNLSREGR